MPKVRSGSNVKTPTHEISLSDGVEQIGLRVRPGDIQEIPQTPSTLLFGKQGGKFGDWEPGFSHIEQRTWHGGRGQEDFSEDNTRFYDSMNAWTMTEGRVFPAPQWKVASGIRTTVLEKMPGSVTWKALTGTQRYIATKFTVGASNFDIQELYVWFRRVGSPGTLTLCVYTDSAGVPDALVASATGTYTTTTITDTISNWRSVDVSASASLTAATDYWVVVYGASTDTAYNHWELGCNASGTGGKISSAGSSWSSPSPDFSHYYRIVDTDVDRRFHFFMLEGALYAADQRDDGTAASLWINGDRGTCDSNSGALTTLVDATKTWTTDQWADAVAHIIAGPGLGEYRTISSNTGTTLTVSPAFSTTQTTSSRYVIVGTKYWTLLSTTGLTGPVTDVCTWDNVADLAQGNAINVRRYYDNNGTHTYADDGTNKADLLRTFYDPVDGPQIWRGINTTTCQVSRASIVAAASNLSFGTGIDIGDYHHIMTHLTDYNDQLWVLKQDSLWSVKNDRAARLNVGVEAMPSATNGLAAAAQDLFLYFSWSHSVERLYGGTLDDVGPWRGAGLPSGRQGNVSVLEPVIAWLFAAIDGGTSGTSSVLVWDGRGWHEIFRAWESGKRIRSLKWQPVAGGKPILWIDVGGELAYVQFPQNTLNPTKASSFDYQHEAVIESSTIDMAVSDLPKFFKDIAVISKKLTTGIEVRLEYQLDDDIGTSTWIELPTAYVSPRENIKINEGKRRQLRYRMRLLTKTATTPPIVEATVVKAFSRTPYKRQWNIRVNVGDLKRTRTGGKDHDPDDIYDWLLTTCQEAGGVRMRSSWKKMDDIWVVVEPPTLLRRTLNTIQGWWSGTFQLTLREA